VLEVGFTFSLISFKRASPLDGENADDADGENGCVVVVVVAGRKYLAIALGSAMIDPSGRIRNSLMEGVMVCL